MQVRLRDGSIATIPDGLSAEETLRELDKAENPKPSKAGFVGGALLAGAEQAGKMLLNVGSYFGGTTAEQAERGLPHRESNLTRLLASYRAHQPDLPWYGQLGTGLVEFLPQIPVYEAVGGPVAGAVRGVGQAARILGKSAPEIMALGTKAAPGFARSWAGATGRAALVGGGAGAIAGAPAGTPTGERAATAAGEAAGFAVGVAGLYPVSKVLGKVAGMAFERGRSRRARAKNEMLGDAEALRSEGLKPPEFYETEEAPIVISPVEEELGPLKVTKNDFKRFKRLGYTRGDLVGMEMGDFVKILKERRVKGKVEEVAEGDTQGEGGLAGGERGGEEPRGTVQEPGAGEGEALAGGDIQAHEGLEAEAEVAAEPPSFQKSKEGRDPAKVGYLLRAGYQPKEIKKMSPEEFETNYAEAEAAGKATNAPEDLARIQKIKETILGTEAKEPIATAFRGPEDVAAKEEALRLLDEAAAKREVEPPSELDVEEIRSEIEQIYNTAPEAVAPVKVALAKSEGRALTNMEKFRAQLETMRAAGLVEAEKLPSKGEVRRRKAKAEPEPELKTAEDFERRLEEEGMPAELGNEWGGETGAWTLPGDIVSLWKSIKDALATSRDIIRERVAAERQEVDAPGAKILGELEGERGSFSWKRKPPQEVLARGEREGEELIEVPEVRKVNPFKSLYQTPLYVNRPEPLADRHIYDLNVAELTASSNTAAHYATIMHAASGLSKEEQIKVKDILEGRTTGDVKLSAAAMKARKWFDMMKDKYKLFLREQYAKHLSPEEQAALRDLIMGKDIEEVKIDHQYKFVQSKSGKLVRRKNIDPKVLEEIAEEYKKIDSWGLTDYLSHVERGRYKMLVDGKLIGVGLSRGDARRKANAYWERNPGKTIYIDPEFSVFEPGATGLSRNQYYAVQSGLAKALQGKVEGLSKSEAQAIARSGMGGKFAIQPTEKFSPYTQPRRGIFEGEQNIFDVMRHYAYTMEKKMALDPVLEGIRGGIGKIKDPQVKENLLALAEAVKGQYWWEDKVADGILRGVSQRLSEHGVEWDPKGSVFSRFTSTSGKIINNLVFGYRPVSGMINFASGQGHIWVKAGVEAMNRARVFGNTPEGKAVIEKLRPTLGETFVEESGGHQLVGPVERALSKAGVNWAPSSTLGKALKISSEPMGFFSAAENPNRELAALTAYTMAKGEGKSEEAALEFARRFTWHTQFTYNTAALGSALRRPAGRLLLKFKPYLLKEMEFISQLKSPTEWARYMALQVALAGPKGFIVMAKSIPFMSLLVPAYFWDELESWANKEFPRASRGIGGFLGVDVSAPATFQFPNQVSDWAGPIASDIVKIYKAWQEVISNEEIPTKGVEKTITSIIPVARSFSRAWDAIVSPDGWVKDERGRRLYHIDNKAAYLAKAAFGAEDLSANQIRTEERIAEERDRTVSKNKQVTVDRFLDAIEDGKEIPDWLIEDMSKYNLRPASIRRAARFRALDPKTRRMLMTEIMRRPEVLEAYPDVPVGP